MTRNSSTPNTAPERPLEMPSAMLGTKMMKAEPTIEPGSQPTPPTTMPRRSEEHTSELQSQSNLVCRLLLEKKNNVPSRSPLPALAIAPETKLGTASSV